MTYCVQISLQDQNISYLLNQLPSENMAYLQQYPDSCVLQSLKMIYTLQNLQARPAATNPEVAGAYSVSASHHSAVVAMIVPSQHMTTRGDD